VQGKHSPVAPRLLPQVVKPFAMMQPIRSTGVSLPPTAILRRGSDTYCGHEECVTQRTLPRSPPERSRMEQRLARSTRIPLRRRLRFAYRALAAWLGRFAAADGHP